MKILGAAAAVALPQVARAQQAGKMARLGYMAVGPVDSPSVQRTTGALLQGLRELGYVENKNIVIEARGADGDLGRLAGIATDFVRLRFDIIVAGSTPSALAAQKATTTIPIIAPAMGDPVGDGLVTSLARPGANITGLTFLGPELVAKRVGLLKEALPGASRVAVLWHSEGFGERTMRDMVSDVKAAATAVGFALRFTDARSVDAIDRAFAEIAAEPTDALIVFPSTLLFNYRKAVVAQVVKNRLPAMFAAREFVEDGGLISYGASLDDLYRRAATYVDKILKGAKPSDLPVEQPTKIELLINLKAAKELGIAIPQPLLLRADELIE